MTPGVSLHHRLPVAVDLAPLAGTCSPSTPSPFAARNGGGGREEFDFVSSRTGRSLAISGDDPIPPIGPGRHLSSTPLFLATVYYACSDPRLSFTTSHSAVLVVRAIWAEHLLRIDAS